MSQVGYYLIIILLGLGNLGLAILAYWQRDKQIKGNALREEQIELARLRNDMAERRIESLNAQIVLLEEIRDMLQRQAGDPGRVPRADGRARRDAPRVEPRFGSRPAATRR